MIRPGLVPEKTCAVTLRFAYNTNGASSHRLDDAFGRIADHGHSGVALTLDHHHLDPFADDWAQAAERVRARLDALGLGCVIENGARYLLDPRDKHEPTFVSASPEGRAVRARFLGRAIDIASILSAETVSFWAGFPKPGVARADAHHWLGEGIARVTAYAADRGVELSLEPEPGMLIETVADYAPLAARFPRCVWRSTPATASLPRTSSQRRRCATSPGATARYRSRTCAAATIRTFRSARGTWISPRSCRRCATSASRASFASSCRAKARAPTPRSPKPSSICGR